jgi:hypothetical protein
LLRVPLSSCCTAHESNIKPHKEESGAINHGTGLPCPVNLSGHWSLRILIASPISHEVANWKIFHN